MPKLKRKSVHQTKKYDWSKKKKSPTTTDKESTSDVHNWSIDSSNNENTAVLCDELENQNCGSDFCEISPFLNLKETLKTSLKEHWYLTDSENEIKIFEVYNQPGNALSVKQSVTIDQEFNCKLFVHRQEISRDHDVWTGLPVYISTLEDVNKLLTRLDSFSVCIGNCDQEYRELIPVGAGLSDGFNSEIRAYREGDFCASKGNLSYDSTVRSVKCKLLVEGNRCGECLDIRRILRKRKQRLDERRSKDEPNYPHSNFQHKYMDRNMLLTKIGQQKNEIKTLMTEIDKLKRKCNSEILRNGVTFNELQNQEFKDLMSSCRDEIEEAYPDPNSFQRLFWEQQAKFEKSGKNGMRWHPMIIKWCLFIRHKSAKAYDAMREAGFIKLPSARTLFDYSHYTKSALGFQPDVIRMLKDETEKLELFSKDFKCYVGLLFDEIRIKEDLVYDKHSGELIGYCNLDSVGNQIMELEKLSDPSKKSVLAKFMLVIMIRGVSTNLKFPLAGFATNSITADFLYPIVWKSISILESVIKLKVLFITCDGASANRKFFQLHKTVVDEDIVYFTVNPYDANRKIFFISDVPHLLKTTRNCFSNSYSHTMTRRLWKNGKDISWLHILRLFEEHCELNLYNPCPKLSRSHLDLSSFNYMKVNLAAQVLSGTVANALEELYDDSVSETVTFIRNFNRFFDCLNVRSLYEGRNKRNPDLLPYVNVNDVRLEWLQTGFLGYLDNWKQSVINRNGNYSMSQKASMQLSHQTIAGLTISVNSIISCVKFMLENGADFVLTHNFNQDPLEQHFGLYRHKGGANNNPTVYEVRNMMTQIRTVGTQAIAPLRGNIQRENINPQQVIDCTSLPRRKH